MKSTRGECNKGFSLVELIIVIAIMAILVGVLAPAYLRYVEKAKKQIDDSAAEEIRHAAEIVVLSGNFPLQANQVLVTFNTSGITVVSGDSSDALEQQLTEVFGDLSKVVPKSRQRKAHTYSVYIVPSDISDGTPMITGSWDGEDD